MTNAFSMQGWPPDQNSVVVVGTNFAFGNYLTCTNRAAGGGSNAIMPNTYRVFETNSGFGFFVAIPDTTNVLPLTTYAVGTPTIYTAGSLYNVITNAMGGALVVSNLASVSGALGYTAANVANIGTIARRGSNDYALSTFAGVVASLGYTPPTNTYASLTNVLTYVPAGSNLLSIAGAIGYTPADAATTNAYALSASLGSISIRGSNDYALVTAHGLEQAVGARTDVTVITNGAVVFIVYKTNNLPGTAFTNYPTGSTMWTTNGDFFGLTNIVWKPIEL